MNIPEKHRLLFRNTYASLRGRIHPNGYAPTSVTGAYEGMFARDASIQIMAHAACGDFDAARRMLTYIFAYHRQSGYEFALHIMLEDQPPYSDMMQADSTFFLLHAWYLYAVHAPRSEEKTLLLAQTEAQAAAFAHAIDTASVAFAPSTALFFVPSSAISAWSMANRLPASMPRSALQIAPEMFLQACCTPLPP